MYDFDKLGTKGDVSDWVCFDHFLRCNHVARILVFGIFLENHRGAPVRAR